MTRSKTLLTTLIAVALATVLVPVAVQAADPVLSQTLSEEFSSYPSAHVRETFSNTGMWGPGGGQASFAGGEVTLKPNAPRGTSVLFSKAAVVNSLPARISFRVRYPQNTYRVAKIVLYAASPYGPTGAPTGATKLVDWTLGTTSYSTMAWPVQLRAMSKGRLDGPWRDPSPVLQSNQWLDGELYITGDLVTAKLNGQALNARHDFAALAGNGLFIAFTTSDDQAPAGEQFDFVRVEQVAAPNAAPSARIAGPVQKVAGEPFAFDATGSSDPDGAIASYSWDFGDGTVASGAIVSHAYTRAGTYSVRLTVTDDDGASATSAMAVTVTSMPPVARIAAPEPQLAGLPMAFDGVGSSDPDGSVVGYTWDFGDGQSADGAQVSHAYSAPGNYIVALTVVDNDGVSASATATVEVRASRDGIVSLIDQVKAAKLNRGQKQKLLVELRAALSALDAKNPAKATLELRQFVAKLRPSKHVPAAVKADWIAQAKAVGVSMQAPVTSAPGKSPERAAPDKKK